MVVPKGASKCRSKGPKEEWIERTYDHVVASGSLKGKISQMEVEQDFESRPHKAVLSVQKREGEGAAWLQWRKVARKEYEGEGQTRRSGRRGQGRKEGQESNRSKSGCMHQGEGK